MTAVRLPDPREEPTIDVKRAGAICGLAPTAAYAAVKRGEIPSLRFGHKIVVPSARLLDMLGLLTDAAVPSE